MSGGCLVGCAADVVPGRSAAVNPRRAAQSGWRAAARPRILRRCSPIRSPRCSPASFATSVSRSATPIFRSRPSCRVFGALLVDEERLLYPGDVLHEAGHIPVASPQERSRETLKPRGGDEIAAIAWSYAAARRLEIDPAIVPGYRGSASAFISNFAAGRFVGTPLLQWYGMTFEPRLAQEQGVEPFPSMLNGCADAQFQRMMARRGGLSAW